MSQTKSKRGFASMSREKLSAIGSLGGKAAQARGMAHRFTAEEARTAGRKGGKASHKNGNAHRFTREEAIEAGRKGGKAPKKSGQNGVTAIGNGKTA